MSSSKSKISQGANVYGRVMNPSPDEPLGPFPKPFDYPPSFSRDRDHVGECYEKHETEVIKWEAKITQWFEEKTKKVQNDEKVQKYVQKPFQKMYSPTVQQNVSSFVQKSENFFEQKTKRLHNW